MYDIKFATASINGTYLIDMPHIGNYSFAGVGGTVFFKNSKYGEIKFLQPINGSGNNLTNDVKIAFNFTEVLSNVNSGLNKLAEITLYNMTDGFTNPKILRDNVNICDATTTPKCYNSTPLNAETVKFNVSSWTTYHIGESV